MTTTTNKVLGQVNPAATTLSTLYTVPALTQAVASTLAICNLGISTTFRIAVRPAGAAIDPKHYLAYDCAIQSNETLPITVGLTLAAADVVSVYAGHANVSFGLFGCEIA